MDHPCIVPGAVVVIFFQCQVVSAEVLVGLKFQEVGGGSFFPFLPSDIVIVIIWIVLSVRVMCMSMPPAVRPSLIKNWT